MGKSPFTALFPGAALFLVGVLLFSCAAVDPMADETFTLTKIGQQAPAFSLTTLDGAPVNPADMRGKVLLLNFFATW